MTNQEIKQGYQEAMALVKAPYEAENVVKWIRDAINKYGLADVVEALELPMPDLSVDYQALEKAVEARPSVKTGADGWPKTVSAKAKALKLGFTEDTYLTNVRTGVYYVKTPNTGASFKLANLFYTGTALWTGDNSLEALKEHVYASALDKFVVVPIRERATKHSKETDYYKKHQLINQFMWNHGLNFDNSIFNKKYVSEERLERAYTKYLKLKKLTDEIEAIVYS